LIEKREDIKVYVNALSEKLKEEKNVASSQYKGKNMQSGPAISV
jgi:hypothetical protein